MNAKYQSAWPSSYALMDIHGRERERDFRAALKRNPENLRQWLGLSRRIESKETTDDE